MSSTNDTKRPAAHEMHTLLRNADDITRSAASITTECRRFMAHLQKVLAGPDAQVFRQEMGEALARLLGAFDGYAAAVAKHSVAFAVAVDDAAGWVDVVKASSAAAAASAFGNGNGGGGGGGGGSSSNDEGAPCSRGQHEEDALIRPKSSSSYASGRTTIKTTRPLRITSVDSSNTHASFSSFSTDSPSHAPVPPTHTTPPFRSISAFHLTSPLAQSRTVSPDPQPQRQLPVFSADDRVPRSQEAFTQVGISENQRKPSPTRSPSPLKAAFTFRAPELSNPATYPPHLAATTALSRSSSAIARTPSPAGATYCVSSSSSRTCSPFSTTSSATSPLSSPSPSPSTTSTSTITPTSSLRTAAYAYTVVARGVNVHGNRWERRDYGPDSPHRNTFHYANADGSTFSSQPDGSERFESKTGRVFLRAREEAGEMGRGRGGGWRRFTGPAVGGRGDKGFERTLVDEIPKSGTLTLSFQQAYLPLHFSIDTYNANVMRFLIDSTSATSTEPTNDGKNVDPTSHDISGLMDVEQSSADDEHHNAAQPSNTTAPSSTTYSDSTESTDPEMPDLVLPAGSVQATEDLPNPETHDFAANPEQTAQQFTSRDNVLDYAGSLRGYEYPVPGPAGPWYHTMSPGLLRPDQRRSNGSGSSATNTNTNTVTFGPFYSGSWIFRADGRWFWACLTEIHTCEVYGRYKVAHRLKKEGEEGVEWHQRAYEDYPGALAFAYFFDDGSEAHDNPDGSQYRVDSLGNAEYRGSDGAEWRVVPKESSTDE
ncbi:hypothetical protein JOL62DRAFT_560421 [Phyllosticta paracitricarpa]|uniref:Uncharacterized protein n=1 Tax=Phyllosticta paracitricarpa TaxID=2016321 RepID=A0ABR1MT61_9PEZI